MYRTATTTTTTTTLREKSGEMFCLVLAMRNLQSLYIKTKHENKRNHEFPDY